jgi:hypothetical protein
MMTDREIHRLVEDYIGTDGGYLCGFSYSKHNNFYVQYCDMDVDVPSYRARGLTTRRAFIAILKDSKAREQARIIRGVFEMFPRPTSRRRTNGSAGSWTCTSSFSKSR